jgi:hypothetical protein
VNRSLQRRPRNSTSADCSRFDLINRPRSPLRLSTSRGNARVRVLHSRQRPIRKTGFRKPTFQAISLDHADLVCCAASFV